VTEQERRPERDDDIRFPDPRPFRRIQLATVALIVIAGLVTLVSGSRPAEVRWGTIIGVLALIAVVLWATRRARTRRDPPDGRNTGNPGE
jgi:hypothetical protein